MDKTQKGSDHSCSLEPDELTFLINQIRSVELSLGHPIKKVQESELPCYNKLGKCVVYADNFEKGHKIAVKDLKVKVSVVKGLDGSKYEGVMGKELTCDVKKDDPVFGHHF